MAEEVSARPAGHREELSKRGKNAQKRCDLCAARNASLERMNQRVNRMVPAGYPDPTETRHINNSLRGHW